MISRKDLNYLNMSEVKMLAKKFQIPVYIHYVGAQGEIKKTNAIESKRYLLDKLYSYLALDAKQKPVIYSSEVVGLESTKSSFFPDDPILFGEFKSTNKAILKILKQLTNNEFHYGAIAFIEAHKLWRKGKVCSVRDFAELWKSARQQQEGKPLEEWAYMTDVSQGFNRSEWKEFRAKKAKELIKVILSIDE